MEDEHWMKFSGPNDKPFNVTRDDSDRYHIEYNGHRCPYHFDDRISAYSYALGAQWGAKMALEENK